VKKYRTIVADPPWAYPGGVSAGGTPGKPVKSYDLPYEAMSLEEIARLPISDLAEDDAWVFCWTTNRYLIRALDLVGRWGFAYRQLIVWNKPGASPFGGTFAANGAEYLIGCSRGEPELRARWPKPSVVTVNRQGAGGHSRKPEVFIDLVEHCCPGPYLEMFARRARFGWDYWGDESLNTAEVAA
jgi:N6-adenosine-specific RNA methylase IME4